jgi:hypothetical protein
MKKYNNDYNIRDGVNYNNITINILSISISRYENKFKNSILKISIETIKIIKYRYNKKIIK